jgi:hypothetical protein
MPYSVRGRVLVGATLALLASASTQACGSGSHGGGLGAGGEGGAATLSSIDCARNSDCPGALLCDRDRALCVECLRDSDCADDATCLAGSCHAACRSDKDCRALDQLCGDAGVCVDCITDAHCARGEVCSTAGVCETLAANDGGAPGTGGSQSSGGDPSGTAGESNSQGGAANSAEGGMSSLGEGGTVTIGPGCATTTIDPCSGLPHFVGTQTVDGDPSEFCDVPPFDLDMATATYYRAINKPPVTATTKATFRVGWSATALHVFIDVADETVHPNTSSSLLNIWNGDNLEFYASPKTPAGLFSASRTYESGAFEIIAAPPGALLPAGHAAFVSTGAAYEVPAAQYKVTATAKGYSFEGQIPWTGAAPTAGMPMGFDAGLSDDIDGLYSATTSEYRDYYVLLYNASYLGNCTLHYEPYCDSRNWCHPTALP